jgi:acetyl-CoA carboxylase biotin carboxyl carrier protein
VSLTAADVAEIMRLVEQSVFDELTLEMDGVKLSLRRGAAVAPTVTTAAASSASPAAARPVAAAPEPSRPADLPPEPGFKHVESPMLGTFYRSPKPGAAPFVAVGSEVEEETVIAIIEVMKLMNTVRAGVRGTVAEILPADGTLVEYGEVLMRVRASG